MVLDTFGVSSAHLGTWLRSIVMYVIQPVISRNTYSAVPENMPFFSMLTDERCHIRTLAARRIIKAREIGPDGNCARRFVIPVVNFGATDHCRSH
ncbi:hypothetical protein AVEN_58996-1 [Araneus ventricosus]|uniref:Uncharacterized protein n=1 Tax=Araneus ventricosus TaxID=182803 RepID=A0A4Y2EJ16_ARAVE|nr:hypothetical protein AVEN_58996-1 [Araneus ventricosus]